MNSIASDAHVEFRHIGKRFGGIQALSDVNLAIARKSIHGLVGENGAGKSTLGKILAGVVQPDAGELWVSGRCVLYGSPREALADHVTMIAQEPTLVPRLSVLENVFLGIELNKLGMVDQRGLRRRFSKLVEDNGFDLAPDQLVSTLRVADRQKVEILRAVARQAEVIIMDEPTAALTFEEARHLFDTARRLRAGGATIVYVSHFLTEILSLVDTVTVLRDGKLVRTSPVAQETPESLVESMVGRAMELSFPKKVLPPQNAPIVASVDGLCRPPAIVDISFEIRKGEILGLAGLIGSGRSEVARAVFGADRAASGQIRVNGRRARVRSPRDGIRAGIAMVPESRKDQGLLMRRSIAENMTLPHLSRVSKLGVILGGSERRSTQSLMQKLDVRAPGISAMVATLSGGNQQKVLFGKWLLSPPSLLIADEPTRGIDVGGKLAIYALIQSLALQGMAVLLISSEHEEVIGLAHRVLVMRKGRIVAELEGEDINEMAIMHALFATGQIRSGEGHS